MKKLDASDPLKRILFSALLTIFLCLFIVPIHAQNFYGKITRGNNKIVKVTRKVPKFTKITNIGNINVNVHSGLEQNMIVTADENIVPYIETAVKAGVLEIKVTDNVVLVSKHPFKVKITVPTLEEVKHIGSGDFQASNINSKTLEIRNIGSGDIYFSGKYNLKKVFTSGSGNITINGINSKELQVRNQGSGKITLYGKAKNLTASLTGSGHLNAKGIASDNVSITMFGSGKAEVAVNEELNAQIMGVGEVRFVGTPKRLTQQVLGHGKIIKSK